MRTSSPFGKTTGRWRARPRKARAISTSLARRSPRELVTLAAPVALVVLPLAALFPEGGYEPYPILSFAATVVVVLSFLLALPRRSRLLRIGAGVYLAACVACHGETGLGVEAPLVPKPPVLAGQHVDYLEQALYTYRNGRRKNVVMDSMAQMLTSDEDVKIAAAYFAKQSSPLATATTDSK